MGCSSGKTHFHYEVQVAAAPRKSGTPHPGGKNRTLLDKPDGKVRTQMAYGDANSSAEADDIADVTDRRHAHGKRVTFKPNLVEYRL
mmetsp:Transcript_93445/g.166283  ORF Transcript_93445/g.166283 Transcript_93445/m.166283 type:complete len:87 (-) Transcript_93445:254-514(-)|eukprot:CAMPEP_0197653398 /NCGR_PEP_ID=MMETSP1338-20131121/35375_1 /TAXON_ID=43686 ORGANISM="Pelagodinium beii, Strain RCC1491" /NCGR_SAMPLE_ID=MMETSP1338 /ASSEMBLY_ACC=CAM_ASM_000754 /LENGTH=86 /DNA_ID=CAMNT_0043228495 /DNA_START=79 /DNA_END=339 /DNA_ORIENTATION=-